MKKAGFPLTSFGLSHFSRTKHHFPALRKSWRRMMLVLGVLSLALMTLAPAWAGDGGLDPSFNPGAGVHNIPVLWAQVHYNDGLGKSMITGSFTAVGSHPTRGVARLLTDGSPDTSFTSPVISGWVNSCFLLNPADANSQMLIAGPFEVPSSGGAYYGLARLNANGTVDTSFPHTFGPCPGMSGFGVQSDGKIIVGGYALPVNGDTSGTTYYLLRLNANGTVDDTFPKRSAPGGFVRSVQAYPSTDPSYPNQVRLLGCFPRLSDPTHLDYMLLLGANGSTELARLGDEIVNGMILQMWIQGDGKMVIVGNFDRVYNTPMNGVARLLPFPNVGLDPDFNQFGSGANGYVQRVVVDSGNKPVIAGYFTAINGAPCGYFARLNYNGSLDTTFNTGGIGANDRVWTMFKRSDNTWMIFGAFQSVNGSTRQCMANLAANGALNPLYGSFSIARTGGSTVYVIEDSPQGLYIGGDFSGYAGKYNARMARLNFDGTLDPSFKSQMDGRVKSIRTQPDGKILVAGNFGNVYGYTPRTGLVRFNPDGTLDRSFFPLVVKADGAMPDICTLDVSCDDGKIMIGGDFAQIADANRAMQPRTAFARLNPDGTLDPTFDAQITIPGGSNIRVNGGGGEDGLYPMAGYVLYQGANCGFYTRLTSTGALDTTFGPSGGPAPHVNLFNGEVRCGTDQADGKVIVGGDFTQLIDGSGSPPQVGRLARFTANGLLDNTFVGNPGANDSVYDMQRQRPGAKILIGGKFTSYNGVARNYVARMNPDGSLDNRFNPGTGANGPVYAIQWNDYIRKARIGGAFTTYDGVTRMRIAQIFAGFGAFNPAIPLLLVD